MLEPQEVSLLQTLVRAGRLTQDGARAFAQALEARRAAGERPNLTEALVSRKIATPDELARAMASGAPPKPSGRGPQQPAPPGPPPPAWRPPVEPEAPTVRGVIAPIPLPGKGEQFIDVPARDGPPRPALPTGGWPTGPDSSANLGAPPSAFGAGPPPRTTASSMPAPADPFGGSEDVTHSDEGPLPVAPPFDAGPASRDPRAFATAPSSFPPPFGAGPSSAFGAGAPSAFGGGPSAAFPPSGGAFGTAPGLAGSVGTFTAPPPGAPGAAGAAGARPGNYALETRIGEGSVAEIYKARNNQTRRAVALKVFRGNGLTPEQVERILNEARAASRIRHPNVVAVHEAGRLPDGRAFIALDLIEGTTLAQTIQQRTLGGAEIARVGSKIAAALQAAHEQGVFHGDVKPSNVLLDDRGEPFLSDFGTAKPGSDGAANGLKFRGTPGYVAPELVSNAEVAPTAAADIYSLGATLYNGLTRQPPWKGDTPIATVRASLGRKPVKPRKLEPTVPPELEAVVMKTLERDPRRRYKQAGDLAEDLRRFLDGRPLEAQAGGGAGASVAIGAIAVVLVAALGAGGFIGWRKITTDRKVAEIQAALARNDVTDLEARARAFLQERPDDARAHRFVALLDLVQHNATDAAAEARRAVELSGGAPEDLLVLGRALLETDKGDEARTIYEKALSGALPPALEARARAGLAIVLALSDVKAAKAEADRALAAAPQDDAEAQALAGRALLVARDPQGALAALDKALGARPKDETILTDHASARAALGDVTNAMADIDAALAAKPDHAPAKLVRARLRLATGDAATALQDAEEARQADPASRDAHLVAALALAWATPAPRLEEADARASELAKLAPGAVTTALARAQIAAIRGRTDDALAAIRDAVTARKEDGLLLSALRCIVLKTAGRVDEARTEAEQLARNGETPDARWLGPLDDDAIANAFKRRYGFSGPAATGQALKAEALLLANPPRVQDARTAIDAAAKDKPARLAIAEGYSALLQNRPQDAVRLIDAGATACPDVGEIFGLRAQLRFMQNQLPQALDDAKKASRLEPQNWQHRFLQAQIRLRQNDPNGALSELEAADRASPRPVPHLCALKAQLLLGGNRVADARKAADRGLQADPTNAECLFYRGLARLQSGDPKFDEDLTRGIASAPPQLRLAWALQRVQALAQVGRAQDADKAASDILAQLEQQPATGNAQQDKQLEGAKMQVRVLRAQMRVMIPDRAADAYADIEQVVKSTPSEYPDLLALHGFIAAAAGKDFIDDVKKLTAAPAQVQQRALMVCQPALQFRIPGPWPEFVKAFAEASPVKEIQSLCWKLLAVAHAGREQFAEAEAAAKKAAELQPNDPQVKQLLDQIEAAKQKKGG